MDPTPTAQSRTASQAAPDLHAANDLGPSVRSVAGDAARSPPPEVPGSPGA